MNKTILVLFAGIMLVTPGCATTRDIDAKAPKNPSVGWLAGRLVRGIFDIVPNGLGFETGIPSPTVPREIHYPPAYPTCNYTTKGCLETGIASRPVSTEPVFPKTNEGIPTKDEQPVSGPMSDLSADSSAIKTLPSVAKVGLSAANSESRTALVIGNSQYPKLPLSTPINDARALSKSLQRLGFNVTLLENARRSDFISAIEAFGKKLNNQHGVGLVFYAGHGMQVKGRNYLIPVDADVQSEMTAVAETVDTDWLLGTMAESGTRINIVILDACRNNPYERRIRGSGRGLAQMSATDARGTLIAYSTDPGKTASDGAGRHSPYAQALLDTVETQGLTIEQVFKQVRIKVMNATNDEQTPWETSSLTGEFQFK